MNEYERWRRSQERRERVLDFAAGCAIGLGLAIIVYALTLPR